MHIIVIVIASSWGSKQQNYVIRNDEVIHSRSWMKCFCWCVAETSSTLENTTTKIFSWITPEWLLHIAIERERLFSIVHNYQTPMTLFGDLIRKISLSPQEIIWWPHKINWPPQEIIWQPHKINWPPQGIIWQSHRTSHLRKLYAWRPHTIIMHLIKLTCHFKKLFSNQPYFWQLTHHI